MKEMSLNLAQIHLSDSIRLAQSSHILSLSSEQTIASWVWCVYAMRMYIIVYMHVHFNFQTKHLHNSMWWWKCGVCQQIGF